MRRVLTLIVAAAGGLGLGLLAPEADALPSPALRAPVAMSSTVANAQYYQRHPFWRRQGPIVVPKEAVETDPNLAAGGLNPPVVRIMPARPTSCGEFRYWDGERCVDARYNNPYLGPR